MELYICSRSWSSQQLRAQFQNDAIVCFETLDDLQVRR